MMTLLIISLLVTTTVSIIGTLFNLKDEDQGTIRPLGWVFVILSIVLLAFSILLALGRVREETKAKLKAETRQAEAERKAVQTRAEFEKKLDDSARRYEMALKRVTSLALDVWIRVPAERANETIFAIEKQYASYLVTCDIRTAVGVDYKFHRLRKPAGEYVAVADVSQHGSGVSRKPQELKSMVLKSPKGEVILRFSFSPESDYLSRGANVGDFDGALVYFDSQVGPDIPPYGPRNTLRVELVANPGPSPIRLICFDIGASSWREFPNLGLMNLKMTQTKIALPSQDVCNLYPKW